MESEAKERVWYRIVGKQRTETDEVLRSKKGRFHDDPDAEPTSYLADSLLTAWREVSAHLGLVPADPGAFRAWKVILRSPGPKLRLLDLRDPQQQKKCGVTEAELLADPVSPRCKEVARKARESGFDGIIYKSVRNRPSGVCVAVFLECVGSSPAVEWVTDDEWETFTSGA